MMMMMLDVVALYKFFFTYLQPNPRNPVPTTGYPVPKPSNKSIHYHRQTGLGLVLGVDCLTAENVGCHVCGKPSCRRFILRSSPVRSLANPFIDNAVAQKNNFERWQK